MDTIERITLQKLSQIDLVSFCLTVQKELNATSAILQEAPAQCKTFSELVTRMDERVKLSRKKDLTEAFALADAKRDRGVRGYRGGLSIFNHASGDELAAYEKLHDHWNLYNFTPNMGRVKQTAVMLQFLPDLRDAKKLAGEVALLNLTSYVDMMEEGNNEVIKLEEEANHAASQTVVGETKAIANALIEAYHELIKIVNALITLRGEAKFARFRDYLNSVIVVYKRRILGQKVSHAGSGNTDTHPGDNGNSGDEEEEPPQG
ncbi:MAG: DUF6261 family protein [Prevotellaceae bacterium]|jgi:hypothetical protein|nr:DUF6261 family protein [Prevotellaceae bacterium]